MKKLILVIIILLIPLSFGPAFSQSATPAPEPQNAEVMGEDDRLPFMQTEQSQRMAEPGSGGLLVKTFGAMLIIVGLIFGGAWVAKKFGFASQTIGDGAEDTGLAVLKTVSLGTGKTISAVRFGERTLLVGSTAQNITLLAESKPENIPTPLVNRSVAELLGDETSHFQNEFHAAERRIAALDGGTLS